jgi:hypothetical protein
LKIAGIALSVGSLAIATLSGCAGLSRTASYGNRLADAKTVVDGRGFSLWMHPTDHTILIQRAAAPAIGRAFIEGLTFNAAHFNEPKPIWMDAARTLTDPAGCAVTDAYTLDDRMTWEAPYQCPQGVDLRAEVMEQRDRLRGGERLTPIAKATTTMEAEPSTAQQAPEPVSATAPAPSRKKTCPIRTPSNPGAVTC